MNGTIAYALSKQYVSDTADSLGSLKGAPCTIKSITEVDGGQKVTFEWKGTSGTTQTSEMTVKKGISITDIDKLPKYGIRGTLNDPNDTVVDEPCAYGSTAMVVTGSLTEVYILTPNNEWVKM